MENLESPACVVCGTVLGGPLGRVAQLFGIRRSGQNPNLCSRCGAHLSDGGIVELTVFFADLAGFTAMTSELGPEKSFEIVNAFFKKANEILVRHDAFIDKFIGDAVMALFNVPIHNDDHVQKAVAAALALQESMKELSEHHKRNLQIRIGLAAGFARVGRIGSHDRRDYTAIGDVVNLASRLEASALPGEIMMNEQVYARIAAQYPGTERELLTLKGFEEKVGAYRLLRNTIGFAPLETGERALGQPRFRRVSLGALLFAMLGAPCMVTSILGPLSLLFGAASFFGATARYFAILDQPGVQIPLQGVAILMASLNLYAIWYGYRRYKASDAPAGNLLPLLHKRVIAVTLLSLLSLVFILTELFIHLVLNHRLAL